MNSTTIFAIATLALLTWAPSAKAGPGGARGEVEPDHAEAPRAHRRGVRPVWISLHGGYQVLDLTTFRMNDREAFTADLVPASASGPVGQLAAGVRLLGLTLGARGTIMSLTDQTAGGLGGGTLWGIDGELGFHIAPDSVLDPFLLLGGGYTAIGGLHPRGLDADIRVRGYNAHAGLGLDYYINDHWAIGALALGQVLFVTRPGVSASDLLTPKQVETLGEAKARALQADGSSVGTALSIVVGPSLRF